MDMTASFTVYGEPQGKGRPRISVEGGHARARTPDKTVCYENLIKTEYRLQCGNARFPDNAAVAMAVKAFYGIPKSASKKKRAAMLAGAARPTKKPDADNVLKAVADSLNGIAYKDDAQIASASLDKYYGEAPRLEVTLAGAQA